METMLPETAELALLLWGKATVVVVAALGLTWLLRRHAAALRSALWGVAMLLLVVAALSGAGALPQLGVVPRPAPVVPVVEFARSVPLAAPESGIPWWSALWLMGVVVMALGWLRGAWRLAILRRRSDAAPDDIRAAALEAAATVSLRRGVEVRLADIGVPCMFGYWRCTVLLPREAVSWRAARLRNVLLHEIAHARRGDYLAHLLATAARVIYWPNPLVWWAARRAVLERELACDDVVLAQGVSGASYAEDLLWLARTVRHPVVAGAPGMASGSPLAKRVRAALSRRDRAPLANSGRIAVTALAGLTMVPVLALGLEGGSDEHLRAALAQLASPDMASRQLAAWRLGEMEAEPAVPELLGRLSDPDPEVRAVAAWALGEIKDGRAVSGLVHSLSDPDVAVVCMAVRALGECEAAGELPRLREVLATGDPGLGAAAAFALGEIGTGEAIDTLRARLRVEQRPQVVAAALRSLGEREVGSARDEISRWLAADDARVRVEAVRALGRIGEEEVVPRLLPLLRDANAVVRESAVWALDEIEARR